MIESRTVFFYQILNLGPRLRLRLRLVSRLEPRLKPRLRLKLVSRLEPRLRQRLVSRLGPVPVLIADSQLTHVALVVPTERTW